MCALVSVQDGISMVSVRLSLYRVMASLWSVSVRLSLYRMMPFLWLESGGFRVLSLTLCALLSVE